MAKVIAFSILIGLVALGIVVCVAVGWLAYKYIIPIVLLFFTSYCMFRALTFMLKRIREGRYANGEVAEGEDSDSDERGR